jgi:hypothetical protein
MAATGDGAEFADLAHRLRGLLRFAQLFDQGVGDVVRAGPSSIARLFDVIAQLDDATVTRLWRLIEATPPEEIASALKALSRLPPQAAHRLLGLTRLVRR